MKIHWFTVYIMRYINKYISQYIHEKNCAEYLEPKTSGFTDIYIFSV